MANLEKEKEIKRLKEENQKLIEQLRQKTICAGDFNQNQEEDHIRCNLFIHSLGKTIPIITAICFGHIRCKEANLFIHSLGKTIPITAICFGQDAANKYMAANQDESLISVQEEICFMAKS